MIPFVIRGKGNTIYSGLKNTMRFEDMTRGVAHRNESSAVTQVSVRGHRASPRSFFFSSPFRTHL